MYELEYRFFTGAFKREEVGVAVELVNRKKDRGEAADSVIIIVKKEIQSE